MGSVATGIDVSTFPGWFQVVSDFREGGQDLCWDVAPSAGAEFGMDLWECQDTTLAACPGVTFNYPALKEFLKGKTDSKRASDTGPSWVWQGRVSVGAGPQIWLLGLRGGCSCARELGVRGAGGGSVL